MEADASDTRLVLAARDGDRDALARLIDRHRPLLLYLCRRALGDPVLAEDAAQEACLQAMLSLRHLRRPDRFGAWLAGIGLNVCRRWLHQARWHDGGSWEALHGGWQAPEPVDSRASPEELAEGSDLAERVRSAVAGLPRGQRSAVLLFYVSGLTYVEAAAQLGVEVGAVKTRLHKARASLRRKLMASWEEEKMAEEARAQWVEMRVADVRWRPDQTGLSPVHHVVLLEEVAGTRQLPIWIGRFEAEAMATHLAGIQAPRPQTFSFAADLLQALGVRLRQVRIVRLTDNVFYATAMAQGPQGPASVDARPSDAINLALAAGAPIYVHVAVLEAAAACPSPVPLPVGQGTVGAAEMAAGLKDRWAGHPCGPRQAQEGICDQGP